MNAVHKTYYSAKNILSKGSLFNMTLSERSDGKTFNCKYRAIEEYDYEYKNNLPTHAKLYLRRWKSEITPTMYNSFMDEVIREYPQFVYYEFKGCKDGIKVKHLKSKKWEWLFYFMPLTMAGKKKSNMDIYRINEIDFDEYVPLDGMYIKDEMTLLLELYNSVDRERYTTKLLVLGNKVDLFNPFFNFFNLTFDIEKRGIRTYKDGTLSIEIYANDEHREARKNSPLAKLIKGTQYEKYMFGDVLKMPTIMTKELTEEYENIFSFKTEVGKGTIWVNKDNMIISNKTNNANEYIVDKLYNMENKQFTANLKCVSNLLKGYYRQGLIFFEDKNAFNKFEAILKKVK